MASTVTYLAWSFAVPASGPAMPAPIATPMVTVVFAPPGEADVAARRADALAPPLVSVAPPDLPRQRNDAALGVLVDNEARLVARASPATLGGAMAVPSPDEGLDAAVTAEHDTRIGVLRQRVEELRQQGASATLIDGLNVRLRRAVAARSLAAARQAIGRLPATCQVASSCPTPSVERVAAIDDRDVGHPGSRRMLPLRTARAGGSIKRALPFKGPAAVRVARLRPVSPVRHPRSELAAWFPNRVAVAALGAPMRARTPHRAAPASDDGASTRARQLLATARRLLEPDADARAAPRLAGLIYWRGSETWSLTDCPRAVV